MSNNCYLLRCASTGDQVLIDAAAEPSTLLPLIGDAGLTHVVTTHQHWDHHRALSDVVAATGAEVVAGAPDAEAITQQTGVPVTRTRRRRRHHPGRLVLAPGDPADRPHARLDRPPVRRRVRPRRTCSPATRSSRAASATPAATPTTSDPARRRRDQALRRPARRDLVLPRPRQRLDARRRTAADLRVARPGLVARRGSVAIPTRSLAAMTDDLGERVANLEAQVQTLTKAVEAASRMQLDYLGPRIYMRKNGDLYVAEGDKVREILAAGGLIEPDPPRDA